MDKRTTDADWVIGSSWGTTARIESHSGGSGIGTPPEEIEAHVEEIAARVGVFKGMVFRSFTN